MLVKELVSVIDGDTKIIITKSTEDIYDGYVRNVNVQDVENEKVKCVWYSTIYQRMMIEI